jgi:hypothetical protein
MLFPHKPQLASRSIFFLITLLCVIVLFSSAPAQVPPGRPGPGNSRPPFGPNGPGLPRPPGFPNVPGGLPGPTNPLNPNPPEFRPPSELEFIWTCSKCGKELGRGAFQPRVDKCPSCGANFINGIGPRSNPFNPPENTPPAWQPTQPAPREFYPSPSSQPIVNKGSDQSSKGESQPDDNFFTFAVAMGIGTILVGVIILVVLGIVMVTNSGNGNKRRRTLHYPEERYF